METNTQPLFKFRGGNPGNYRVYYHSGRHLYCIQNDGAWGRDKFVFYSCSRDGEPSHELRMPLDSSFDRKVLPASLVNNPASLGVDNA